MEIKLILASASPRRQELLRYLSFPFKTIPAELDETIKESESPVDYVTRLAYEKATKVARNNSDYYVIGVDTIVVLDQLILGKPQDVEQAAQMLESLSGQIHQVITSYAIVNLSQTYEVHKTIITEVEFNVITNKDILDYISKGESFDKAGGYALQGEASKFIRRINGSHTNVIGLDIASLKIDLDKIFDSE